ncbi:molybdenum cofactor guanylyltransferase [Nocardioides mesophilus]|uniref:Molybdenum cofactor guanylyltransferase n=1 Tax=Nocardioides mesophilus TaxID=433659 RepID=A0A7G9RG17_9ACTN|nr:molybdenum cofactor guanylyltransferase [Nocardioides mesophilus]QNN54542.1 molybdenum cofactor guanylyltransferase [Nocardioides mesophilus]
MPTPTTGPNGPRLAAVVLAGGTGERLGGVDKAALVLDGSTLLERALAAVRDADEVLVVGPAAAPRPPTSRPVTWTHEQPPGGGPAAGLLAGVDALAGRPDLVVVLAVDMPRVSHRTVRRLVAGVDAADGAVLVDADGRRQTLAAVYRWQSLQDARPADPAAEHGLPVRRLVARLRLHEVPVVGDEAHDVDTWDDLGPGSRANPSAPPFNDLM